MLIVYYKYMIISLRNIKKIHLVEYILKWLSDIKVYGNRMTSIQCRREISYIFKLFVLRFE